MTYTFIHTVKFAVLAILLFVSFITYSHTSHAYFTTAQKEIALDNGTGLFLIDYAFGMTKYDVIMPILARNTSLKSPNAIEYSIIDETGTEAKGKMTALVLSKAQVNDDGMYTIEKNTRKTMTLAVFFTPEIKTEGKSYRLQVTSLPFNFNGTQQLQLNPSELKYYTTKLLDL